MQRFSWKDRDTAAHNMLQLVYHGPEHIRLGALRALQAIRSSKYIDELKAIALDVNWPFAERSEALRALAVFPKDLYLPELVPLLKDYWAGRWKTVEAVMHSSLDSVTDHQLHAERNLSWAILTTIGAHQSNYQWFFEFLEHIAPTTRSEVLSHAIGATCQSPLEPLLIDRLTELLDLHPALFTLTAIEVIANHGIDKSEQWLVCNANKIIALSASADSQLVSSILGYCPELTSAIAEKDPELAKLSPFSANYEKPPLPESVTEALSKWKDNYDFTTAPIGQQINQLYTQAASGDENAFSSLFVLSDDSRVSVPVRAVITHFLGKLWPHERVLEQLCLLVQNNKTWDDPWPTYAIRLEAAEALHNTATSAAWEALVDVIFLSLLGDRHNTAYVD
jgi:HEAT repeat protein